MAKIKFSAAKIKSLKATKGKYVEYYDINQKHGHGSLGIRISPKGKKSWFVLYRGFGGRQKRYPLGNYPDMTLAAAGTRMAELGISSGNDPIEAAEQLKKKEQEAREKMAAKPTMNDLWEMYAEIRDDKIQKGDAKAKARSTVIEEDRKWKSDLAPVIGDLVVEDIKRSFIKKFLNDYAIKSPVAANRLHSLLSVMFKVALDEEIIEDHPMFMLDKPFAETARNRVLSEAEIKQMWKLLDNEADHVRDSIKLMLLTAQRSGEIFSMQFEAIRDLNGQMVWDQQDNKTRTPTLVPLSPQAAEIMNGRFCTCGATWVFPSSRNSGHLTNIKKPVDRLNNLMGTTDNSWTLHDLRRTAATLMGDLAIDDDTIDRCLNHKLQGTRKTYNRASRLDEKREALVKLGNEIDRITGTLRPGDDQVVKDGKVVSAWKVG